MTTYAEFIGGALGGLAWDLDHNKLTQEITVNGEVYAALDVYEDAEHLLVLYGHVEDVDASA
jgi:hypothetical protein